MHFSREHSIPGPRHNRRAPKALSRQQGWSRPPQGGDPLVGWQVIEGTSHVRPLQQPPPRQERSSQQFSPTPPQAVQRGGPVAGSRQRASGRQVIPGQQGSSA
jgi:hypothetical protein